MKAFWNERYAEEHYAYGTTPNLFLKTQLPFVPKGKVLFVAEGEGRNAVYAAQQGFEVEAIDYSEVGKNKAERLAQEKKVEIQYQVASAATVEFEENYFDAIVFIFAHFPPEVRVLHYQRLLSFLKPNGHIVFEAFGKEQIQYNSGGPKQVEMLFDETDIKAIFTSIDFELLETRDVLLDEGPFHQGKANVIRFLGKRKLK
jgi:2-polyprenyl-3-methyl-5-hydroxy-6-metoxy-1,4-benzoquinol methylase